MSGPAVAVYRHPTAGFSLPVPAGWERLEDPGPGVALIAREPSHPGPFRANVVVTVEPLAAGVDVEGWQAGGDAMLALALEGYRALDLERLRLDERDVIRRLAHHTRPENGSITMEQWTLVADGLGYTLTASAGTLEYDALADLFARIAEGFRP